MDERPGRWTRRRFLGTAAGLGLLPIASPVPSFLVRAAGAAAAEDEDVLVVLELSGGNDGLNTVIPYADSAYHRARPTLALAEGAVLRLDGAAGGAGGAVPVGAPVGLHPSLQGLRDLFGEGVLAIIQGVGYPDPSRSHFRAMDIWHTASPEREDVGSGWLAKAAGHRRPALDALHLGDGVLPLALTGEVEVPTLQNLDWLEVLASARGREVRERLLALHSIPRGGGAERVRALARATIERLERVIELRSRPVPIEYPSSHLADRLRWAGQLIAGGFPSRIYYLTHGGFDTHARQNEAHPALLTQASEALLAFYRHLQAAGAAGRVSVLVFSEFGRRVAENSSLGTDHGCAAPVFIVSQRVAGGVHGPHPSLADLDAGDLRFHTDFRRVYATLLEGVLGVPSEPILGGRWEKLPLLS
jgi:uncharacterized protein (DUF1501 family)